MADAGFKLSVEGEKEFKRALAEINNQIKANAAELKMLTAQYTSTDSSMVKLTANQKALEASLGTQGQKVALLREQYEKAAAEYGETDSKVVKLKTDLANATVEYSKMSAEVEKNQAAINANWEAMEKFRDATEKVEDSVGGLDEIMAQNRREVEALAEQYKIYGESARDAARKQENLTAQNKLLTDSVENQRKKVDALNDQLEAARRVYGDTSEEVRGYKKQVDEATDELKEMQKQVKENEEELSDSGESANGLLEALEEAADQVGIEIPDGLKKVIGGADKATLSFAGWSAALGAALGVAVKITEEMIEVADKYKGLYNEATALGMDTTTYQKLQYALQMIGLEASDTEEIFQSLSEKMYESKEAVEEYGNSLQKIEEEKQTAMQDLKEWAEANTPEFDTSAEDLFESYEKYEEEMESFNREYSKRLQEINDNYRQSVDELDRSTQEATAMFSDFGIAVMDSSGNLRDTEDVFYDVIRAFGQYANDTNRITQLQQIFGGAAGKVNIAVNAGEEALRKYGKQAEETGQILDEVTVNEMYGMSTASDILSRKMDNLGDRFKVFFNNLLSADSWLNGGLGRSASSLWQSIAGLFDVPKYATGTYSHIGGYDLVGEKGPEIVRLPQGSQVYPTGQGPQTGVSNVYNVTISAKDVREFNDIVRIAQNERQSIRMGYTRR